MEFQFPGSSKVMEPNGRRGCAGIPAATAPIHAGTSEGWSAYRLSAPDNSTIYHFTYSRETHTLVPLTRRTAAHYPALMPSNDPVRIVQQMNGNTGAYGNGYGDFQLPEKWFRKVTHTEPGGAANRSQPVGRETNRASSAAGSGGDLHVRPVNATQMIVSILGIGTVPVYHCGDHPGQLAVSAVTRSLIKGSPRRDDARGPAAFHCFWPLSHDPRPRYVVAST